MQTNLPIITYAIMLGVAIAWGQGGVGEEVDGHPAYANKEALTSIEGIGPKQISPVHFWDELSEAASKYRGDPPGGALRHRRRHHLLRAVRAWRRQLLCARDGVL